MVRFSHTRNTWQVSLDGIEWMDCSVADARRNCDVGALVVTYQPEEA